MIKEGVPYFLSGGNFALESILERDTGYNAMDVVNIKDINRRFGTKGLDKLEFITSFQKFLNEKLGKAITYRPLNYIDYNRDRAFSELSEFCGFEYYGAKHLENVLTAFIQTYWLPKKFGFDKRKSHFSSMIVSGQMTRKEALAELEKPFYDDARMQEYIDIMQERLGITAEQFEQIMEAPTRSHTDFKTDRFTKLVRGLFKI